MYQVIIVIHVLLGLGIIGLVMMQQGKGADAGAAFGTGSSGSVFGAQGAASFLSRTTAILAGLFFLTSLGLAILNSHKGAAYDLMSGSPSTAQTVESDALLPTVDGANSAVTNEAPVTPPPVAKPENATTPVMPSVQTVKEEPKAAQDKQTADVKKDKK